MKTSKIIVLFSALLGVVAPSTARERNVSDSTAFAPGAGRVPAWTTAARWYYINIPRFANGDRSNDPEGAVEWSPDWPVAAAGEGLGPQQQSLSAELRNRQYGGDLRGVIERLDYLKKLGVNAICLSPAFQGAGDFKVAQVDLRHVDDAIGVRGGFREAADEGDDAKSWVWTSSDKALLELIRKAHESGIRVVVSGMFFAVMSAHSPPSELEAYYMAATRRWMDPDGDKNPSDGVDGWLVSLEEGPPRKFQPPELAFWLRWREAVASVNPGAVVISSGPLAATQLAGGPFDIALVDWFAGPLGEFFGAKEARSGSAQLFASFESSFALVPPGAAMSNISMVSGTRAHSRLLTAVAATEPLRRGRIASPGPLPDESARLRAKLAVIVQHFLPGAPGTYYGDEVGMYGGPGEFLEAPMWWNDGVPESARPQQFQADFFALVQWLHLMREEYAPLREGRFRRIMSDDANRIMAFARSLAEQEIVLVVNHGSKKQLVMLPAGRPGQMVGVRSPHLHGPPEAKKGDSPGKTELVPLSVAGARQFVNPEGKIRMWLDPHSVRVVFIDKAGGDANSGAP